jgi:beta-xylosidase
MESLRVAKRRACCLIVFMSPKFLPILAFLLPSSFLQAANPIISDVFTADPAPMVVGDTLYLYTSHDEAGPGEDAYVMKNWLCYSTTDMVNWKSHGVLLSPETFDWGDNHAYAGQAVQRDGQFYWYVPMGWKGGGFAIGVAVSDSPSGPFRDAIGHPLISSDMTPDPVGRQGQRITWDDIDPTVFIDDDGQAYIFWGNTELRWAKLKSNMIELDGGINVVDVPAFEEAAWVHKRGDIYYLSYASGFPERIAYATAKSINGPWEYQGIIKQLAGNCSTNHHGIVDYKGRSYIFYHDGGLPSGGSYRRSTCVDYLLYDNRGRILPMEPTLEGVVHVDKPLPASISGERQTWVLVHGAWAGAWEGRKWDACWRRTATASTAPRTRATANGTICPARISISRPTSRMW